MKYLWIIPIILLGWVVFSPKTSPPPTIQAPQHEPVTNTIIKGVNEVRAANRLKPLTESPKLDAIAKVKANDMCQNNYWAHDNPNGKTYLSFFANYPSTHQGENLAHGFISASAAIEAWVNSSAHYANIIDPRFTQSGAVAIVCPNYLGVDNDTIMVNEFGLPR